MDRFIGAYFFAALILFSCAVSQGAATLSAPLTPKQIGELFAELPSADKLKVLRELGDSRVDAEVAKINHGHPGPSSSDIIRLEKPRTLHDAARLGDVNAAFEFLSLGKHAGGANYDVRDDLERTFIEVAALYGNDDFVKQHLNDLEQNMLPQLKSFARRYENKDLDPYWDARNAVENLEKWLFLERFKIECMKKRRM